jgi:UDP-glucose 4-epimerase
VLHGAIASGVSRFVFISSGGAIYGETPDAADERTQPRPENPYGRHKLEGERIVAEAPIAGVSLRLSNVYGPRQRSDVEGGVASIFAERLAAGLPLRIYGDGGQQRDFVHVADVVSAIMLALGDPSMDGVWNVGTGAATSVNDLAALMIEAFAEHALIERLPARGEIRRSCLDVTKLRSTGRWSPSHTLAASAGDMARAAVRAFVR